MVTRLVVTFVVSGCPAPLVEGQVVTRAMSARLAIIARPVPTC